MPAPDLGLALARHCQLAAGADEDAAMIAERMARAGCPRCHGRGHDCTCDGPCPAAGCLGGI